MTGTLLALVNNEGFPHSLIPLHHIRPPG